VHVAENRLVGRALLIMSLVTGAATHAYNVFHYPLAITDEGIYLQQAWAVLREGRLSPYTYFYDHAPAGWLVIAAWIAVLPLQFETFGNAINTGRALMVLVHIASIYFLFQITRRLSGSLVAATLAAFFFNFSPLAVFYQRQVLLDNIMVLWLLISLDLAMTNRRIITAILSGLALGLAILTKENAVFFAPVVAYALLAQIRDTRYRRFARSFWLFAAGATVSLYFLYATLNNELVPTGLDFDLSSPPADHVSLLYTIWWQFHRSQGSILDPNSLIWQFSLKSWLPKDTFILEAGAIAMLVNLLVGLTNRQRRRGYLVAGLLAATYAFYLVRGSQMLEFYVVPFLAVLAINAGMLGGLVVQRLPALAQGTLAAALCAVLLLPFGGGYFLVIDEFGKVVPHDLYKLPLTDNQAEQVAFIRDHIPPDARIVMDDDIWVDLHDVRPFYKWAHSHWKVSADPDVRDKLFRKDWHNIDYVVMSNKMLVTMQQNNGDHSYDWILEALNNGTKVWSLDRGNVNLAIYQVRK
jgi:4-amino-4-deoxy-L-arabinose transferase-like glycosyltransferase